MIERQPAHRAVAFDDAEAGRPDHAGEIGHQRPLGNLNAVRLAGAAGGELDVAEIVGAERPQVDRLFRQRVEDVHPAMEAHRRELVGGIREIARQIVKADRGDSPGRGELTAKLVEIGVLAADSDRNGDGHGQQTGILRAEEGLEEARPGIGRDQDALAPREPRADELARGDVRPVADFAPRQGRKLLALGIIKGHPGLALRRVVEHRGHGGEAGAVQSERGIAGGQQFHRKAGVVAEG